MMPLGTRSTEAVETLEDRIFARLRDALEHQAAAGIDHYAAQGLATCEPADDPVMRMSLEDVARVAAAAARSWF